MDFVVPNEAFAHQLYANWDNFCHHCVERIIDEYLSAYDKDKLLCEIEKLDLDLGAIPEDDFYRVFPLRLKEELFKHLSVGFSCPTDTSHIYSSRLDNLFYYLEHGYCLPDWIDRFGRLDDEINWLQQLSGTLREEAVMRLSALSLSRIAVLHRLLLQSDNLSFLQMTFRAVLTYASGSRIQKYKALMAFLDEQPDIVVRFIQETSDNKTLALLSDLLTPLCVQTLLNSFFQSKDTDQGRYAFAIYEWLIENYPDFGHSLLGSKEEFVSHLHRCLLSFIRKGNDLRQVSVLGFVQNFFHEVFGAHDVSVLFAIEEQHFSQLRAQRDGSGLSHLLYQIFHELYLHHITLVLDRWQEKNAPDEAATAHLQEITLSDAQNSDQLGMSESAATSSSLSQEVRFLCGNEWKTADGFIAWLSGRSDDDHRKVSILRLALSQHPGEWLRLLSQIRKEDAAIQRLSSLLSVDSLLQSLSLVRFSHLAVLKSFIGQLHADSAHYRKEFSEVNLSEKDFSEALLLFLRELHLEQPPSSATEVVERFFSQLYGIHHGKALFNQDPKWKHVFHLLLSHLYVAGVSDDAEHSVHDDQVPTQPLCEHPVDDSFTADRQKASSLVAEKPVKARTKENSPEEYLQRIVSASKDTLTTDKLIDYSCAEDQPVTVVPTKESVIENTLVKGSVPEYLQSKKHARKTKNLLSHRIQYLFQHLWNREDSFVSWMNDHTMTEESQQEVLRAAVIQDMKSWIVLLENSKFDDTVYDQLAAALPISVLQQGFSQLHISQTAILSALVDHIRDHISDWQLSYCNTINLHKSLSKTVLLYLQQEDVLHRSPSLKEVVEKFLSIFYQVHTGKQNYHNDIQWQHLLFLLMKDLQSDRMENFTKAMDILLNEHVAGQRKKNIVEYYLQTQPRALLAFIRDTVMHGKLSLTAWTECLNSAMWIRLFAQISLEKADFLYKMLNSWRAPEKVQRHALADLMLKHSIDEWIYVPMKQLASEMKQAVVPLVGDEALAECVRLFELPLTEPSYADHETADESLPQYIQVHNAGLCLLSPWFVRLFSLQGYLDEEWKHFKDIVSKMRAVFLLQYLCYGREDEYDEADLVFNRLLTALPEYIPLPKSLMLTDDEKQIADGMINGVKANWKQMSGTSVEGFRQSFIARSGLLEQEDERWLLKVDDAVYDVLLDSVPWGFRQLHFPWLKKHIQVLWHE